MKATDPGMLSAQTTDSRVNQTTHALFARYPTPEDMAVANPEELEEVIRPAGFFRAKARSLIGLSTAPRDSFGGEVPGRLEDLVTLPASSARPPTLFRVTLSLLVLKYDIAEVLDHDRFDLR